MKHRYVGNNLTWLLKEKGLVKQTCDFLNVSRPTEKSRPSFIGKAYSGHQQVKKKMGREIIIPEERESPLYWNSEEEGKKKRRSVELCLKEETNKRKRKKKKKNDVNWPTSWLDQLSSLQTNLDTHPIRLILLKLTQFILFATHSKKLSIIPSVFIWKRWLTKDEDYYKWMESLIIL